MGDGQVLDAGERSDADVAQDRVDVLVVDDDDAVRTSMAALVRSAGYVVAEAADGLDALELLGSTAVGMMLLDIQMPRMNGYQLLQQGAELPPVVVVSARHRDAVDVPDGADVFLFLRKPVPPMELLNAVELALVGRRR